MAHVPALKCWAMVCVLVLIAGCAATPAPGQDAGGTSPRVLGYGAFLPQCVVLCFATGQSSQADRGADVTSGDLTTKRKTTIGGKQRSRTTYPQPPIVHEVFP